MGLNRVIALLLPVVMVATVASATPLPFLKKRPSLDILKQYGKHSGIDIGQEIHKMHLRQRIGVLDARKYSIDEISDTDEVSVLKKPPGLFDDTDIKDAFSTQGVGDRMPSSTELDDLDQELQQVDYSLLALELQELTSPAGNSDGSATSGLMGFEDELILLTSSGMPSPKRPEHYPTAGVFTHLNNEISLSAEDLESQLQHHAQSLDAELQSLSDSDITNEGDGSEQSGSGEGYLEYHPSLDNNDNMVVSTSQHIEDHPSVPNDDHLAEVSGSGEGNLEYHPSLDIDNKMSVSNSVHIEDRLSIPKEFNRERVSSGAMLSGSGDLSGSIVTTDSSVHEELTFTSLPQTDIKDPPKLVLSIDQQDNQQSVRILDSSMSGSHLVQMTDGYGGVQGNGKGTLSMEEGLELELEGLSLVTDSNASVDDSKEENDAGSGCGTGTGTEAFVPALSTMIPAPSDPGTHGDYGMLTPIPSIRPMTMDNGCLNDQMACRDGVQCVPVENFCDLVKDCEDGSDEDPSICASSRNCGPELFKCGPSAQCVSQVDRCDGIYHCSNGEDEKDCKTCTDLHGEMHVLTPEDFCDGVKDCADGSDERRERCELPCSPGYRKCKDGLQCVKEELFCNGIYSCHDMSDEIDCGRTPSECQDFGMFACDGLCHPMSAMCDSTYDCSSGIDEDGCDP
ncbi:uncharacterized protein LOC119722604 [Patiria miniata]|uniref:Uncharacterized protein n=1 Tax=Patiria miniata TaxID=46514 RepID=A0A913ZAC4_PATMI|nr:uncharacterized protein LOC119722604 [Patiria miniata]